MVKMKDSKIQWIGEIPFNWVVMKAKYHYMILNGATPSSSVPDFWNDGNIVWITPADYGEDTEYIYSSNKMITSAGLNSCGTHLAKKASIIVSNRAPIGQVALSGIELCTNQGCKCLENLGNSLSKFHWYFLKTQKNNLNSLGKGTTFLELSTYDLSNYQLPIPSIKEQNRIVIVLDKKCAEIDSNISDIETSIKKLKEYKKSVITEAVTKGLDSEAPMRDSGIKWIGQIPKAWAIERIKYNCELDRTSLNEKTDLDYEFEYIDISSVNSLGEIKATPMKFADSPSRARMIVNKNDVIVSTVRTYLRAIAYIDESNKYVASTGFAVLTPKKNLCPRFFMYFTRSEYFIQDVVSRSYGVSYPAINGSELINIYLTKPREKEQQQISDYLDKKCADIDSVLADKIELVKKLKEYKNSLIYECVTGKREVG